MRTVREDERERAEAEHRDHRERSALPRVRCEPPVECEHEVLDVEEAVDVLGVHQQRRHEDGVEGGVADERREGDDAEQARGGPRLGERLERLDLRHDEHEREDEHEVEEDVEGVRDERAVEIARELEQRPDLPRGDGG